MCMSERPPQLNQAELLKNAEKKIEQARDDAYNEVGEAVLGHIERVESSLRDINLSEIHDDMIESGFTSEEVRIFMRSFEDKPNGDLDDPKKRPACSFLYKNHRIKLVGSSLGVEGGYTRNKGVEIFIDGNLAAVDNPHDRGNKLEAIVMKFDPFIRAIRDSENKFGTDLISEENKRQAIDEILG